jgi:rhodanese-related sulfurtransferase
VSAKANATEGGSFGVDEALLRRFVPMNGLDARHLAELVPFAGISELHPGDSVPTNFKTSDQAYYVVSGKLELYKGSKVVGTVAANSPESRFPLSHIRTEFGSALAKGSVRLLRVDRSRVSALLILEEPSADASTRRRAAQGQLDSGQLTTQLLKSQLFSHIPPANVQRLVELAEPVQVHTGDVVTRQGEQGNYCYILVEGRCSVSRRAAGELLPRTLGELGPGDSFGEEVLGQSRVRRSTVTMRTHGWLRRLSRAQFEQLAGKSSIKQVSWPQAQDLVARGARWIDVRLAEEHRNDGVAGSLNLPLAETRARSRELNRKVPYVVCCNTGQRSMAAAFLLRDQGFSVCVLEEGLMGRDTRGGSGGSSTDDLKAQLMLADAEIQTAMRRKVQADAARNGPQPSGVGQAELVKRRSKLELDAARAGEALAGAKRRKLELEHMIRAVDAKAASERKQADSVVEQLRQQTDVRLQAEKQRLQGEYLQASGAMDDLRKARSDAEYHFQKERERLEAQIAQARNAMMSEAERIRTDMESAKRAAVDKAERIRREQAQAEQQLRAQTEARLLDARRKLESQFKDTINSVRLANQDVTSAESAKRDAQREAARLATELRAAEQRSRERAGNTGRAEASRRLQAAQQARAKSKAARPSDNVVQLNDRRSAADAPDFSDTVVALRTELHGFEDKVNKASGRIDAAERARAQAQRAQLLLEEKLARQQALEEELRLTLYEEAESWLAEDREHSAHDADLQEQERKRREAKKASEADKASAASDMMSDIRTQLAGEGKDEDVESAIERSLRARDEAQHTPAPTDPEAEKAAAERRKAKEALDRAREHVQRLKNKFDKD